MRISVDTNAVEVERRLNNLMARQIPFATSLALTATAHQIREAQKVEMRAVFDRPTPFTMNAFQVVPARKDNLFAEVRYKDSIGQRSPGHYLETQVQGGGRPMKAYEARIGSRGSHSFAAVIPTRKAKLDRYGNWSAGERQRVLSALQVQSDFLSNETAASRKRNPKRATYYIGTRGNMAGVFRNQNGQDALILIFAKSAPSYTKRFDFHGVGKMAFNLNWQANFDVAMERALATAR